MANTASAKKRIRQSLKRRTRNQVWRTRARSNIKRARTALGQDSAEAARESVLMAVSELDRAASKGVIHKRNASRRKSRLMKQLNKLQSK
ncbi:MAG: 30S ribosomal protein S20 [Anaerolineales bacterium]|nr:MAG: 30S ribosomal protein S20 [Anaerolineales bacterium]